MTTVQLAPHLQQTGASYVCGFLPGDYLEPLQDPRTGKEYAKKSHASMPNVWRTFATCIGPPAYPNGRDNTIMRLNVKIRETPHASQRVVALEFEIGDQRARQIAFTPFQWDWFVSFLPQILEKMEAASKYLYFLGRVQEGEDLTLALAQSHGDPPSCVALGEPAQATTHSTPQDAVSASTMIGWQPYASMTGPSFCGELDSSYNLTACVQIQAQTCKFKSRKIVVYEQRNPYRCPTLSTVQLQWLHANTSQLTQLMQNAHTYLTHLYSVQRGEFQTVGDAEAWALHQDALEM